MLANPFEEIGRLLELSSRALNSFDDLYDTGNPCLCEKVSEGLIVEIIRILNNIKDRIFDIIHTSLPPQLYVLLLDVSANTEAARDTLELVLASKVCKKFDNINDICNTKDLLRRAYVFVCTDNTLLALAVNLIAEVGGKYD